jgi:hypothetical protein
MDDVSYDLLNLYEIDEAEGTKHYVCFLDPVLAGARGIDWRSVVGEFDPRPDGDFDPATFRLNPDFVAAFAAYMNGPVLASDDVRQQAQANPDGFLHLLDPRCEEPDGEGEPPVGDLLGGFAIDEAGQPVPDSFRYNPDHIMFDPQTGPSGILVDRKFYHWLHGIDHDEAS